MVIGKWLLVIGSVTPAVLCLLSSVFCPRPSTTVKSPLQISSFMQNKANFRKSQMNVNKALTRNYENKTLGGSGKNEPKTNPIRTQTNPIKANLLNAQMNVTVFYTKDYGNKSNWAIFENEPNTNPIKANFKRPTYTAGNCFQHSMRTLKIRRLGHTPETKHMTLTSSNNWKAEGL